MSLLPPNPRINSLIQIGFSQYQRVTRLLLTKKFVNRRSRFNSQIHGRKNVTISLRVSLTRLGEVRLGYLDVAIAKKIRKTRMPSCAIDSQQRLF